MKRICKACGSPVLKRHRWRNVNRRFLWWSWKVVMHLNCKSPEEGAVTRLKGEVPLPFPGPMPNTFTDADNTFDADDMVEHFGG